MVGYYTGRRTQTVTWWPRTRTDRYGDPVVSGTPSEILVRWERTRRDMMDPTGTRVAVDVVMVYGPDDAVGVEDTVFLGDTETLYGDGAGTAIPAGTTLYRVKALDHVPSVDGVAVYREAGLVRKKGDQ
jgi:hypothetical protein